MSEAICAQELFCHLQDCNLNKPHFDEWQSFQSAIACWVDCWFGGVVAEFVPKENHLEVNIPTEREPFIVLEYTEEDEYPLRILVYNEEMEEMEGDSYNMTLYDD